MAHRIKSGKGSENYVISFIFHEYNETITKKEAKEILYDPENLITACRGNCNDSFNLFFKPLERDALIKKIYEKIIDNK